MIYLISTVNYTIYDYYDNIVDFLINSEYNEELIDLINKYTITLTMQHGIIFNTESTSRLITEKPGMISVYSFDKIIKVVNDFSIKLKLERLLGEE